MLRKLLILIGVVSILLAREVQAAPTPVSWDGGGDGYSWEDANNWDPNIVPDNNGLQTFAVTIDSNHAGVNGLEVGLQQSCTIDRLDTYGDVQLDVPDWEYAPSCSTIMFTVLESANGITNHGMLEIDQEEHRKIEIKGNVINTGGAFLELWDVEIEDGNLHNLADAKIEVDGEGGIENGGINNAGTLVIDSYCEFWAELNLNNTGLIKLYGGECGSDEIVDNNSTGGIIGFGIFYADALCRNKGKIYASGGPLALFSDDGLMINTGAVGNKPNASLYIETAADVNNHGTIEVNAGGGVTFDCNLINDTNGVIELRGGTLAATMIIQKADANFAGFGTVTGDIIIEPNGLIQLTGPTNIIGDVNITENATLEISDGTTLVTGQTSCNGTIYMKGGYIIPQGGLSGDCDVIWEPGLYTNVADFNLDGQVNFNDFAYFADTWLWQSEWR